MSKGVFIDAYFNSNNFFDNKNIDKFDVENNLIKLNLEKAQYTSLNGVEFTLLYKPSCECCPANFELKFNDIKGVEQTIHIKGHAVIFFDNDNHKNKKELMKIFSVNFQKTKNLS